MIESALFLALIGIVAIVVMTALGGHANNVFSNVSRAIASGSGSGSGSGSDTNLGSGSQEARP
jgi:Flp pilus assembly pilin Flp